MMNNFNFSGSIVLYNPDINVLGSIINSFLDASDDAVLYLVDNSAKESLAIQFKDPRIIYIFVGENIGFGAGHNIAIREAIAKGIPFHFIINPDVHFDKDVVIKMLAYMKTDPNIGLMMPRILNPDGTDQYLPKLLPSPLRLICRKLYNLINWPKNYIEEYELRKLLNDRICNVPVISGCFSLVNLATVGQEGLFDESYFIYFEDWDLSRRISYRHNTIYFPIVSITHDYASGANFKLYLLFQFIRSAFIYFNKWGWFFDSYRDKINSKTLNNLRS